MLKKHQKMENSFVVLSLSIMYYYAPHFSRNVTLGYQLRKNKEINIKSFLHHFILNLNEEKKAKLQSSFLRKNPGLKTKQCSKAVL